MRDDGYDEGGSDGDGDDNVNSNCADAYEEGGGEPGRLLNSTDALPSQFPACFLD